MNVIGPKRPQLKVKKACALLVPMHATSLTVLYMYVLFLLAVLYSFCTIQTYACILTVYTTLSLM